MVVVIGARDARRRFAELMGRVGNEKEVAIIERFDKPLTQDIPIITARQFLDQLKQK